MNRSLIKFVGLAYVLSWTAWLPLTLHALDVTHTVPSPYWHLAGGCGPALAALILALGDGEARSLLARCVRAPLRWTVIAILGPVALFLTAAAVLYMLGAPIDLRATARTTEYPQLGIAAYVIANILFYGFGEELGWRGYLLPNLQQRLDPLRASLVVAAIWAGWHLPLFAFASGMSAMGLPGIIGWLSSMIAGSFLMTALYNRSRSVLPVALFHGTLDILINSPTGAALQSTMGALVTVVGLGFALPAWRAGRR